MRLSLARAVTPPLEPLSEGMPAIVIHHAGAASSVAEMVSGTLRELESAAAELFPPWLPGAEGVDARLRQDGFVVLRFTNTHVPTDIETVVGLLERFLHGRRFGTSEGTGHG